MSRETAKGGLAGQLAWLLTVAVAAGPVQAQNSAQAPATAGADMPRQPQAAAELLLTADLGAAPVLSDELIRKAVRDTVAEDPHPQALAVRNAAAYGAATVTVQDRMTTAFNQAKVPDCLHDDALKLQPAYIGPFGVVGPFSLPWVVAAALRGKCR
ncbi:hypothetical protein [Duganella qianjiadongensis]|uniref:Uncharacterized protein n=1 Tax=Duganella qianjiadongensis TaxID=2692176 RepID=A0ABW9VIQ8_9BURK|nr:hypothetical protein [Duganella qianjiadongensis]MYM39371.1 hypothetical protein [Duganella qianjiadongensis]